MNDAPPRPRAWLGPGLGLATILVVVGLLATGELLLRWIRPQILSGAPVQQAHVFSDVYGWSLRPDFHGRWANGKTFVVNHSAYRGRELPAAPRTGVLRVVMLGDSVAFGTGVEDGATFSDLLEASDPRFEVANLAVSGYGTDQELLRLEHEGFALRPAAVVLHFCLANDFIDNRLESYLYDGRTPKPYFVVEGDSLVLHDAHLGRGPFEHAAVRLREDSYLFDLLLRLGRPAERGDGLLAEPAERHWAGRRFRVLENLDEAVLVTLRLVRKMADACQARGVRFLVLVHPDRPAMLGDERLAAVFSEGRPELAGLRVIDLRRSYAAAGVDFDVLTTDKIGHLSPRGHAFVAGVLRDELASEPPVHPR
jgi:hypothetical protein